MIKHKVIEHCSAEPESPNRLENLIQLIGAPILLVSNTDADITPITTNLMSLGVNFEIAKSDEEAVEKIKYRSQVPRKQPMY